MIIYLPISCTSVLRIGSLLVLVTCLTILTVGDP